jgi:hypothetical protein
MAPGRTYLFLLGSFAGLAACADHDNPGGPPTEASGAGGAASSTSSVAMVTSTSMTGAGGSAGGGGTDGVGGSDGGESLDDGAAVEDASAADETNESDAVCGGPLPATAVDAHCGSPDGGRGYDVPPHEGIEADDDNCLYHARITVPCVQPNQAVTFTLDLKNIGTPTPATGADPQLESFIGYHPSPNTNPMSTENDGVYTVGPVIFDRTGQWTVTFHIYNPDPAKHSHVSFFIDVP